MLRGFLALCALMLAGCASPYLEARVGRINRPIDVVWVGADKFIYVPGEADRNFTFESDRLARIIAPGLMYTDGGSIPRVAQIFRPFSPWGYAPAYVVHDWIFYGHYCDLDAAEIDPRYEDAKRFFDVRGIQFHDSAVVLAEVIKTMEDNEEVALQKVPAELISGAVDSTFASALWESRHQCERLRVQPRHIAMVWVRYNNARRDPPKTWKLSPHEINQARTFLPWARHAVGTLRPLPQGRPKERGVVGEKHG